MAESESALSTSWTVAVVFIALFSVAASYIIYGKWKRRVVERRPSDAVGLLDYPRSSRNFRVTVPSDGRGTTGYSPIYPGAVVLPGRNRGAGGDIDHHRYV